jgi:hypothetical protein
MSYLSKRQHSALWPQRDNTSREVRGHNAFADLSSFWYRIEQGKYPRSQHLNPYCWKISRTMAAICSRRHVPSKPSANAGLL